MSGEHNGFANSPNNFLTMTLEATGGPGCTN